ncbi:MAG: hypothetical protein UU74_C0033G0024 [Candidatus Woesebacteria bacterium GW2011_GWA1_41_7]|uniref:Uncharacterized protein n=1 Tax=Candidatus Woesebacteria bacterium GW2011_GWA1_41_7 TaxID=1618556 RepID=A0A0G0WXC1_9BACT|nr:MAG: hypothetical protein UU74_C0033G0024 [Candidatus Woesebacteria bacterium GW2011_GWA1_41_7]
MKFKKTGFIYTIEHVGVDGRTKSIEYVENIIHTLGRNYIIGAAFKGASQFTNWYLGAYGAARIPLAADTMITLMADCEELTSYTGDTRLALTLSAVADGEMDTVAAPNIFEFPAGATVRGIFLTTNPTKGNNTGLLVSSIILPSPKVIDAGESLKVPADFTLNTL